MEARVRNAGTTWELSLSFLKVAGKVASFGKSYHGVARVLSSWDAQAHNRKKMFRASGLIPANRRSEKPPPRKLTSMQNLTP